MLSVQVLALAIALSSSGDAVLLDFHASWCAPCRSMAGTIHELEGAGYPVRQVNIDEGRALAAQYHVESIPCYVLLVDGQEVGRLNGAVRRSELLNLYASAGVTPKKKGTVARAQSPDHRPTVIPVARPVGASAAGAVVAAPPMAGLPAPPGFAPSRPSQELIRASVRLTVADPKGFSHGSGTIVDARGGEALVLTCGHLFRDAESKGQITVDCFGDSAPQKVPGKLIAYDLTTDLGLVSFRPGSAVKVARVAP
ncbi:MAG TPA: thioredoxin domain-containing protein, partial [Pirellulales bacterium]